MTNDTAKTIGDFLVAQLRHESKTTRNVLAAVPADTAGYKPSELCMSGLELASHIALADAFFLKGIANGAFEWKQIDFATPAEALAYYDEHIPGLLDQVAALPGEALAKEITFAVWTEPAVQLLGVCLKHSIHHRGQLSSYLRPMGSKVPSIYGPTADDAVQAAAQH